MKSYILVLLILLLSSLSLFGQVPMPGPIPDRELTFEQKVDWLYTFFTQLKENICVNVYSPDIEEPEGGVMAIITGNFGTPKNRIATGEDITVHSGKSNCEQGGVPYFTSSWSLGVYSGGEYVQGKPMIVGSEGAITSFRVPQMSAPIDQKIKLTIVCGKVLVKTRVTAYLCPVLPGE